MWNDSIINCGICLISWSSQTNKFLPWISLPVSHLSLGLAFCDFQLEGAKRKGAHLPGIFLSLLVDMTCGKFFSIFNSFSSTIHHSHPEFHSKNNQNPGSSLMNINLLGKQTCKHYQSKRRKKRKRKKKEKVWIL